MDDGPASCELTRGGPLLKCRECEGPVSRNALHCVHCGRQFDAGNPSVFHYLLVFLFFAHNVVMTLWWLGEEMGLGTPRQVFEPWATGAIVLGMAVLVTKRMR